MKRFVTFILVLAIAVGGVYFWWQANARRIMTAQVREMARGFFVNAGELHVDNDPVKMTGWRTARVPKLVVSGRKLQLRNGPELSMAKLVLKDIDVTGPPLHLSGVGGGSYTATITEQAATSYLRARGIAVHGFKIPLDTLAISFSREHGAKLSAEMVLPVLNTHIPLSASGKLVASSRNGQVDFRVEQMSKPLADLLATLNPVIDVSEWPLNADIIPEIGNGSVTLHGKITSVQPSWLP